MQTDERVLIILLSTGNMQLIPKYVMYYTVNNISINLISHLYPSPNYKKKWGG